ncbi:MAG: ATP-binding cassette domain-containing protein [Bacteroidia bacterium]|nr:ATP-binding cassette domain-containing protein [Bacteroidia bacterium]MCF8427782.1 ATP-binding cassette domain-containing protein [Bacteroidia bacterium]MCF8447313.1 ATP-binding cassette domain-containing protein [Bacteroidia bacterium]
MIELKDITKSFDGRPVLKNVSATFKKGKCSFVIGASGGGKSVLMKCMVGLLEPDSGIIDFDNRDFLRLDYYQKKKLRQEIGMLFQGGALFDSLSVEDNVAFPLRMFTTMGKSEILDRVNFCLKRVKLDNANKLFPSNISGGMKKRVGIARAIALNPKYLFCDEPNSGLDPLTSRVIDELIMEITEEYDITTIVNSHDIKSVFDMGDHIVFIYKGESLWEGNKDNLRDSGNPQLAEFIKASEF